MISSCCGICWNHETTVLLAAMEWFSAAVLSVSAAVVVVAAVVGVLMWLAVLLQWPKARMSLLHLIVLHEAK